MDSKTYQTQLRRVFLAFKEKPKTRLQVANECNILRGNVCYFVRDLKRRKQIAVIKTGKDPITKHKAEFLSTDKDLFPPEMQTKMFEGEKDAV
jgi:hypothetical protein